MDKCQETYLNTIKEQFERTGRVSLAQGAWLLATVMQTQARLADLERVRRAAEYLCYENRHDWKRLEKALAACKEGAGNAENGGRQD